MKQVKFQNASFGGVQSYDVGMPQHIAFRYADPSDAALITQHRHRMFGDNGFASEETLLQMDAAFEPWVEKNLLAGTYVGVFAVDGSTIMAGAGLYLAEFPPHWRHCESVRGYLLNVYTEPEHRGRGLAKLLVQELLEECAKRSVSTVVLHASPQGRPIYEGMGFVETDEMMLIGFEGRHA